jgi:hypothetical protein
MGLPRRLRTGTVGFEKRINGDNVGNIDSAFVGWRLRMESGEF